MAKKTITIKGEQLGLFDEAPAVVEAAPAADVKTDLEAEEVARRDSICKEWRDCRWGEACMSLANDAEGIAYCQDASAVPLSELSRDERKVRNAGFLLVKYFRDKKILRVSEADPASGWAELGPFVTYAQAERMLKSYKERGLIEASPDGTITMSGNTSPLFAAGFEFYRCYGHRAHDASCCIKAGSRNWSNWNKYPDSETLLKAWSELMQDPKALEG